MSALKASIAGSLRKQKYGLWDAVLLAMLAATYFFGDLYYALAVSVVIMIIFALSLDIAQGYGGIETLGHAEFFGASAYGAGLYAMHVTSEPLSGLAVGAACGAVAGLISGLFVVRAKGLTQIMLTLASATMLYELANTAKKFTMGDDGLTGYSIAPVLGHFSFDIFGRTAFVYASVVMIAVYALLKHFVNSPLGLVTQGIRENSVRMRLIGVPVYWRLLLVYTLAAAVAGIAGALSAQVNSIVGMDALGFTLSANVLVMLALGGTGRLYGAFFGAIVFMILSDRAAAIDPTNWLAALGVLLILVVRFAPDGIAGLLQRLSAGWGKKAAGKNDTAAQAKDRGESAV